MNIYCKKCMNEIIYKFNLCFNHTKNEIISEINNYITIYYENQKEFMNIINEKKTLYNNNKNILKKYKYSLDYIKKTYYTNIYNLMGTLNIEDLLEYDNIIKINYTEILNKIKTFYDGEDDFENIKFNKMNKYYNNFNISNNNLILYENKILSNNIYILKEIFKNKFTDDSISNNTKGNSFICVNSLINNRDIMKIIKVIKNEYKLKIYNNMYLYDLYIIIKLKNNLYLDLVIEIDEKHHYSDDVHCQISDIIKDLYCFKNNISLLRIDCKNFDESHLDTVLTFIYEIYNSCVPIYSLSKKYINYKNNYIKKIEKERELYKTIKDIKISNKINEIKKSNKTNKSRKIKETSETLKEKYINNVYNSLFENNDFEFDYDNMSSDDMQEINEYERINENFKDIDINNVSDDMKEDILEVNELNNKIRNLLKNSLINRIDYNKRRKERLKKEKEHFETVRQIILKSGSIYD